MANETKLTTVGQMKSFAERQDARDDEQEEKIRQLEEQNGSYVMYTAQTLTEAQKAQARKNIGAQSCKSITTEQIDAILAT